MNDRDGEFPCTPFRPLDLMDIIGLALVKRSSTEQRLPKNVTGSLFLPPTKLANGLARTNGVSSSVLGQLVWLVHSAISCVIGTKHSLKRFIFLHLSLHHLLIPVLDCPGSYVGSRTHYRRNHRFRRPFCSITSTNRPLSSPFCARPLLG